MSARFPRSSARASLVCRHGRVPHESPVEGRDQSAGGLQQEEDHFEALVLFLVEHLAVYADENAEHREELDGEVQIVAPVVAFEDVVNEPVGGSEYHYADARQVDVVGQVADSKRTHPQEVHRATRHETEEGARQEYLQRPLLQEDRQMLVYAFFHREQRVFERLHHARLVSHLFLQPMV